MPPGRFTMLLHGESSGGRFFRTMPIATVMLRLLTGYAIAFNRRHRRSGHLFQNRYKSRKCSRSDLVGGGLLRSVGGWAGVKALRESGDYRKGDERILGDGDFVEKMLATASERMERRCRIQARGLTLDDVVRHVANGLTMDVQEVMSLGKNRRVFHARSNTAIGL